MTSHKYQTDFQSKSCKLMVTASIGYILCSIGVSRVKNVLKYDFRYTEGRKNLEFDIVVTYKMLMLIKNSQGENARETFEKF